MKGFSRAARLRRGERRRPRVVEARMLGKDVVG